jgi:hypothetical protein
LKLIPIKGLLELHEENPEMTIMMCCVDDQKTQTKVSMLLYYRQFAVAVPNLFVLRKLAVFTSETASANLEHCLMMDNWLQGVQQWNTCIKPEFAGKTKLFPDLFGEESGYVTVICHQNQRF